MAEDIITTIAEAITQTVLDSGAFKTALPYFRQNVGEKPAVQTDWESFEDPDEPAVDVPPTKTRFQFAVMIYTGLHAAAEDSITLRGVVKAARGALIANRRLGVPGVRYLQVKRGENVVALEGENPMLTAVLTVYVDYFGSW